jgi:hypothetical protein
VRSRNCAEDLLEPESQHSAASSGVFTVNGRRLVQSRDYSGRFSGGRRVNVESCPRLPAWLLGRILLYAGSRLIELRWVDHLGNAFSEFAGRCDEHSRPSVLVRTGREPFGTCVFPKQLSAPNRGVQTLVCCRSCSRTVRYLYDIAVRENQAYPANWQCRVCAGLRYRSEGSRNRFSGSWGPYPRSWVWGDPEALEADTPEAGE